MNNEIINRLRTECKAAGGQRAWARAHGISPQAVGDILFGRRPLTDRIAAELGLLRVIEWYDPVTGEAIPDPNCPGYDYIIARAGVSENRQANP